MFASGDTDIASEHVVDVLPGAVQAPLPKIVVHNAPRRQVMGQHPPRAAAAQQVEDPIENFSPGVVGGSPAALGLRHQMLDEVPFFITEISWVWLSGHHTLKNTRWPSAYSNFLDTL